MSKQIHYAVACHTGDVRNNNEDNFYCAGHYLPEQNTGMDKVLTGTAALIQSPVFAVFDGLGGGSLGEKAAYLAVQEMDLFMTMHQRRKVVNFPGASERGLKQAGQKQQVGTAEKN